ncbi:hypothetical protein P618_200473 [Holospora obtusa F1]|uniref:Uncharacterized protein n=1 Tax=Holospora obtusa F1 TaxID=1399147 RepID=W6THF3_HOLOB|nr:hypothetical protein [Holospora obtusa]ETZ07330.1 hypothetical protein P618_200473 [Holospora obtusa F1]
MKLNFFLFSMFLTGISEISFGANEDFTSKKMIKTLTRGSWDEAHVQNVVEILTNHTLLSKIQDDQKNQIILISLEKIKKNSLNLPGIYDFFRDFLPIHAVSLFKNSTKRMVQLVKGLPMSVENYLGGPKNLQEIAYFLATQFVESKNTMRDVFDFFEELKNSDFFSNTVHKFISQDAINYGNVKLDTVLLSKMVSWLPYIKKSDLQIILEFMILKSQMKTETKKDAFSDASSEVQNKMILKMQDLDDKQFAITWEKLLRHWECGFRLCSPHVLYQLDKKKLERSGVFIGIFESIIKINCSKVRELCSAMIGRIFSQYKTKKVFNDDHMLVKMIMQTKDFSNSLEKIEVFTQSNRDFISNFLNKYPELKKISSFNNYFFKFALTRMNTKNVKIQINFENLKKNLNSNPKLTNFLEIYEACFTNLNEKGVTVKINFKGLKEELDSLKKTQDFSRTLTIYLNLIRLNPELRPEIDEEFYKGIISYLPYTKEKNLRCVLEFLLLKELEHNFLKQSENEQKEIVLKINELKKEDLSYISEKVHNFTLPVCENLLSLLKQKNLDFKE